MVNFEGNIIEEQEANISLNNRSFNYADGIFETKRNGDQP